MNLMVKWGLLVFLLHALMGPSPMAITSWLAFQDTRGFWNGWIATAG